MPAGRYSILHHDRSDDSVVSSDSPLIQNKQNLHQPQHKRVYQACIPCRRRKVKCDLGCVDTPNDPPCVRCRRECKECYFSATRRKRKYTDEGKEEISHQLNYNDDYALQNKRRTVNSPNSPVNLGHLRSIGDSQSATSTKPVMNVSLIPEPPLTPGGSIGRSYPLRRPTQDPAALQSNYRAQDLSTRLENLEAQQVMRQEVYGPYDALDLLYKAATDGTSLKDDKIDHQLPVNLKNNASSPNLPLPTEMDVERHISNAFRHPVESLQEKASNPSLSSNPSPDHPPRIAHSNSSGYDEAIKAWGRFRFVRAGWFTAVEAIEYIEYYYEYLSPLTPISPPTFRDPATHLTLLTEEPFLAVTLLSIATRYRQIPDSRGHCRSYAIHEQLWTYLRGMIERCLWGQEAFGGRFYGSVMNPDLQASGVPSGRGLRRGSLRALGTIESLMILTEWHPRALHFPPIDVTDELMIPSYDGSDNSCTEKEENSRLPFATGGVGGKRIVSWLEPAWRSDRMCWMLLSTAMGLSYELGVFDNVEDLSATTGEISGPEYEEESYRLRAIRIKRLLLIYATQLAGRLGWTSMVPENLRSTDPSFAPRKQENPQEIKSAHGNVSGKFNYIPDLELDDQVIHCWAGITNVMRLANETLFKSRQYTTKIIQDGNYVEMLQDFQPLLHDWSVEFEFFRLPPYIRHVLTIEYEYTRIYINSLSLQAVVERCSNYARPHLGSTGKFGNNMTAATLPPAVRDYYGKLPLARLGGISAADQNYVKEVVDGSRNLLKTVVEGLLPNNYLKHAPIRTYFRIVSGAMFLLKTFALGASKSDVGISIGLMDRAVDALRNCIVDDAHLGIRFADLLETLTSRLRCRFISAPADPTHLNVSGRNCSSVQSWSEEKRGESDNQEVCEWNTTISNVPPGNNSTSNVIPFGPVPLRVSAPSSNTQLIHTDVCSSYNTGDTIHDVLTETSDWDTGNEVWYLPPGMAFYQNINDQAVAQTSEGVNVGGMDLLDFMALDPLEPY